MEILLEGHLATGDFAVSSMTSQVAITLESQQGNVELAEDLNGYSPTMTGEFNAADISDVDSDYNGGLSCYI